MKPGYCVMDQSAFRKDHRGRISIAEEFRREGLNYVKSEKDLNAGISLVKRYLRGDGMRPWLYISKDCKNVIDGLREWEYGSHEPDALAALRYALVHAVKLRVTQLASYQTKFNGDNRPLYVRIAEQKKKLHRIAKPGGTRSNLQWRGWDYHAGRLT
jgi:hypothetical protein